MTKVGNFQFGSAVLCEDIRQEKSEKLIFVGVFSGEIFVEKLPAEIAIALYTPGIALAPGTSDVHLRFSGPGEGKAILTIRFATDVERAPLNLIVPRLSVQMECEGIFRIDVSADKRHWKSLVKRTVGVKAGLWSIVPSIAPLPPSEQSPPAAPDSSSQP